MCLALQMGKLRPRFKDSLTAGDDRNSDLPEGSLRAKRESLYLLFQLPLHISGPKPLLGAKSIVSTCEKDCEGKEASHLHNAFDVSEYFLTPISPHNTV